MILQYPKILAGWEKLGLILSAMKGKIEDAINDKLDHAFG